MKLTGSMSQCTACGLVFGTVRGFDGHRVGDYSARRCLSEAQLTEAGYAFDGCLWLTPDAVAYREANRPLAA